MSNQHPRNHSGNGQAVIALMHISRITYLMQKYLHLYLKILKFNKHAAKDKAFM